MQAAPSVFGGMPNGKTAILQVLWPNPSDKL